MRRITNGVAALALALATMLGVPGTALALDEVAMLRLYNPNSGEHFYTQSVEEKNATVEAGWTYEGVGWWAPVQGNPVYRLYNANGGDHHYTTSAGERDLLVEAGWTYEGVGWMSGGDTKVYRQYNPNASSGAHNFTTKTGERDLLVEAGWNDEGVSWYGLTVQLGLFTDKDGSTYYRHENGELALDEFVEIEGVFHYFGPDGALTETEMKSVAQNDADMANMSARQKGLVSACNYTPWPGPSRCAAWITDVLITAGEEPVWGDACDMARAWCTSSDLSELKPGMLMAVTTHPHTDAGQLYGHVGIYVGNNIVRDSATHETRRVSLGSWLAHYGGTEQVKWGWANGTNLELA